MFPAALTRRIQFLVLSSVLLMTLVVTPWANLDPINLPKFLLLGVCGFTLIGNLLPYLRRMLKSDSSSVFLGVMFFVAALFLILFLSSSNDWSQIYGAFGRNTGLISYLALALMLISTVFVSSRSFVKKLIWVLIISGAVNAVYGLFQWLGMDPVDWSNPYNPIVGTLGNPNFTSAHLGIAGLAALAFLLDIPGNILVRLALLVDLALSVFVIWKSDASQGLLIFGIGTAVILYFRFLRNSRVAGWVYWIVVVGAIFGGVLGIVNKGPLASLLYQESVTYRGDYWRAGWKMTIDHPIFGVGLDSYGDWYRFSRSEAAALRRGPDVTSNSAHNVFLDISSNGGFLLLIAYLFIIGLILRSALRVLRKPGGFNAVGVGLVSAWLAYLIQSVVSINQLGLAIWGWVLGGAIIGYDLYRDHPNAVKVKKKLGQRSEQVPASVVLTGTLGLVLGIVISVWPLAKDVAFRSALQSGDGIRLEKAARAFPENSYYYVYAAQIFLDNKVNDKALSMARRALEIAPRDFSAWKTLIANPTLSESEKASAIAKMKELDPFNNTLDKK